METYTLTLVKKAQHGKLTVRAQIPVHGEGDTYVVTIAVRQQAAQPPSAQTLDELYGALAGTPIPEILTDLLLETRDEM